jgi:hypothetical protein
VLGSKTSKRVRAHALLGLKSHRYRHPTAETPVISFLGDRRLCGWRTHGGTSSRTNPPTYRPTASPTCAVVRVWRGVRPWRLLAAGQRRAAADRGGDQYLQQMVLDRGRIGVVTSPSVPACPYGKLSGLPAKTWRAGDAAGYSDRWGYCKNMCKRVRVTAALVICPLILAGCGLGTRPDGLPTPPGDAPCPASTSQITDNEPYTTPKLHGPACRDVKDFQFQEASRDATVDLEHSPVGRIADLSYDHFTGELKPINGARIALYAKDSGWPWEGEPDKRSDYPGEQECHGKRTEGRNAFSKEDLEAKFSIFCIKTAEGHDGFLIVRPVAELKPDAYYVYSYIWVR